MVDIGQNAYTTTARLYPDSDEVFHIRWYEALPDAPLLGFPSALNGLSWEGDREDWLETAVGEIFRGGYQQLPPNRNPLALGLHYCGTPEDFAGHGSIDLMSPPVVYRPDGLPACCGAIFGAQGGLGLGGAFSMTTPNPVLGQVLSSGGTPPVHVCQRMTRDTGNHVVAYSPATTYDQCLNPDGVPWPIGALLELYTIDDWPGWWWGEPIIQYADTDTVLLTLDPTTDVVTAEVVTQLSIDQDSAGVRLVGDSTPGAHQYYGTAPTGTTRGYQDFVAAVTAAAGSSSTITAFEGAIFGTLPNRGLALVAGGGGLFFVGVDQTPAAFTTETLDNDSVLSVDGTALLTNTVTQTAYTNDFNATGLLIDRTAAAPTTTDSSVQFAGTNTISVTSSALTQTIVISTIQQNSIVTAAGGLQLLNDSAGPGISYLYSTDDTGAKGWHTTDAEWIEMVSGVLSHLGAVAAGATTYAYPSSITVDLRGHIYAITAGATPVTSISTTGASGGPISGAVTLAAGTGVTLSVLSNTVTINATGAPVGPAPTGAPTLTATGGNAQVTVGITLGTGSTNTYVYRGTTSGVTNLTGTLIYSGTGTSTVDTGLTNGTTYFYIGYPWNNGALGPASAVVSATPLAPPAVTTSSSSGTTGAMVVPLPTNATGDHLAVWIANNAAGASPTAPTGWVHQQGASDGSSLVSLDLYTHTSAGGEASVTFASLSQALWRAIAVNYGAAAYQSSNSNQDGGASTSVVALSITAGSGTHTLTSGFVVTPTFTVTPPGSEVPVTNGWMALGFQTVLVGATGARTATASLSSHWGAINSLWQ